MKRGGSKSHKKWRMITLLQLAYGGQSGGREIEGVLKTIRSVHDVEWNCLLTFFGCKQNCIEEIEELLEFVGAL